MKKQLKEWEKILSNHVFGKYLIRRIYKALRLNKKRANDPILKWAQVLSKRFSRDKQMAVADKKLLKSRIIRET